MSKAALRLVVLAIALVASPACDLLDTEQPNIIDPDALDSPSGAIAKRDGALSDFGFAKDGDGEQIEDGLILIGGLMADEFIFSTTPPSQQEIDQRTPSPDNSSVSDPLLQSPQGSGRRRGGGGGSAAIHPDSRRDPDVAEMLALAGFTYIYFAESYCSGVPFGRTVGDSLVFGAPLTTTETFDTALARFDAALAHPGLIGDDEAGTITNLARVGRGRALVGLGRFAEAAAAVAEVPTEFVYSTEHADSPLRLQNAIWSYTNQDLWSVADNEGGAGLPYRTAADPRVPVDSVIDEETGEVVTGLDASDTAVQPAEVRFGLSSTRGRRHRGASDRGRGAGAGQQPIRHDGNPQRLAGLTGAGSARHAGHPARSHRPAVQRAGVLAVRYRPSARRHATAHSPRAGRLWAPGGVRLPHRGLSQVELHVRRAT